MRGILTGLVLAFVLLPLSVNAQVAEIPNFGPYPEYGDDFLYLANGGYATLADASVDDIADYSTTSFSIEAIVDVRKVLTGGSHSPFLSKKEHLYSASYPGWGFGLSNNDQVNKKYPLQGKVSDGTTQIAVSRYTRGVSHLVMTWDVTTKTLELFINGVSVDTDTNASINPANLDTTNDLRIGKCERSNDMERNILMVRWWERKLSNSDITSLADNWLNNGDDRVPAGVDTSTLKSEWLMNEESAADGGSGTGYIKDSRGNNHIQLTGNAVIRISSGEPLTVVFPNDGATDVDKSVTLKASGGDASIGGAVTHPLLYFFQVDTVNTFDSPNLRESDWIPSYAEYRPPLSPSTTYYWRVKVKDQDGDESAYTSTRSFTTEDTTIWYARPAGGSYGSEDGSSYANAWDGLENVVWGEDGVEAGDTLYICGLHLRTYTTGPGSIKTHVVASGSGEDARINIRGDCSGDQGTIWGGGVMSHESWVYEGDNVWSITLPGNHYPDWFFEDVTSESWVVLDKESSIEGVRNNPGSFYASSTSVGNTFYVQASDSQDPTGRIVANGLGYGFVIDEAHHINWLNLKFYSLTRWLEYGSTPPEYVTYMKWENCTIWYMGKLIIFFKEGSHHLEFYGCDIAWAQNGIGFSENPPRSLPNAPHHYVIRGNYFHHFGVRVPDLDSHAISGQGSHHGIVENNELYMSSTTICYYAYPDTSITNTTVRWNYVHDCHTISGGGKGIAFNSGAPDMGNLSGNSAYGNIIVNCTCGIRSKWEQEVDIYNNVAYNCGISYSVYNHVSPSRARLKNSISLNPGTLHVYYRTGSEEPGSYLFDSDHNMFYPLSGDQFRFTRIVGGSTVSDYYTFSEWQAINDPNCPDCVWDPNSLTLDPLFESLGNRNFHLQASSPAIDSGIDVGLTLDFEGTPIPQPPGGDPDMGAYEYEGNATGDLVALYHFDEGFGMNAADSSGYGNDGIIDGATWTTGISGYSLEFDGVDDYINCNSDSSIDNLTSFTWEAWIYPVGWGEADYGRILAKNTDGGYEKSWYLYNTGGAGSTYYATISSNFDNSAGTDHSSTAANNTISLNQWQHVVATYDNDGDRRLHIYVDGIEVAYNRQETQSGSPWDDSDYDLLIGNRGNNDRTFDGKIDEVRIYNRALTPEEILDHYNEVKADINNNGAVDIFDLVLMASDFGKTSDFNDPDSDTDNSGEVDVFDMVFVASRFT